jgi:hypothetical protein
VGVKENQKNPKKNRQVKKEVHRNRRKKKKIAVE